MNKLRLPKAFAEKWLEALRSGEYNQGDTFLKISKIPEGGIKNTEECFHCCLGVAAEIIENKPDSIEDANYIGLDDYGSVGIREWVEVGYPEELTYSNLIEGITGYNEIPVLLSKMNDNILFEADFYKYWRSFGKSDEEVPQWIKDKYALEQIPKFSFTEIADFIEQTFEFYE